MGPEARQPGLCLVTPCQKRRSRKMVSSIAVERAAAERAGRHPPANARVGAIEDDAGCLQPIEVIPLEILDVKTRSLPRARSTGRNHRAARRRQCGKGRAVPDSGRWIVHLHSRTGREAQAQPRGICRPLGHGPRDMTASPAGPCLDWPWDDDRGRASLPFWNPRRHYRLG